MSQQSEHEEIIKKILSTGRRVGTQEKTKFQTEATKEQLEKRKNL